MKNFKVTVSMSFPIEGSELYVETFNMLGETVAEVQRRVRIMVADRRYCIAVRPAI